MRIHTSNVSKIHESPSDAQEIRSERSSGKPAVTCKVPSTPLYFGDVTSVGAGGIRTTIASRSNECVELAKSCTVDNATDVFDQQSPAVDVKTPSITTAEPEGFTSNRDEERQSFTLTNDRNDRENERKKSTTTSKRVAELYSSADWWSVWIGLISFGIALTLVFLVPHQAGSNMVQYAVPQPMKWTINPLDAWDLYGIVGTAALLTSFCCLYLLSLDFMGKLEKAPISSYIGGFVAMSFLATISFWIGRNEWCSRNGLGYAIFSILFGMAIRNVSCIGKSERIHFLLLTSKDGEFFIKCSLVLLAVEFSVLQGVGLPAIAVAWIGSPLALVAGYLLGYYTFKMDRSVALLVSVGATWCGASAISAIGSVIGAPSGDMALSISVVAFFTIAFTFAQPYFALGVGMPDEVAGAWIGGSVDQTGNVIAAAAIISKEATEVAGVVKIVLNSGLGILAAVISLWWQSKEGEQASTNQTTAPSSSSLENKNDGPTTLSPLVDRPRSKKFDLVVVWDKFPKFVLGFIFCSGVLTITRPYVDGTAQGDALQPAVSSLNTWWFAIAFVGIGLETDVRDMWQGAIKSGVIKLYLVTNALDIALALGLAYALF